MDTAFIIMAAAMVAAAAIVAFALRRPAAPEARPDPRLDTVIEAQGKIAGQFQQTVATQAELQRTLVERIDALNKRMGDSLSESATKTAATLTSIGERLTVIDQAQKNITALSGRVVSLQDILSDKQARGAWGQDRMEDIVRDQLPPDLYQFQGSSPTTARPIALIRIPGMAARHRHRRQISAGSVRGGEGREERCRAQAGGGAVAQRRAEACRTTSGEKYLIPGEVQSPAHDVRALGIDLCRTARHVSPT